MEDEATKTKIQCKLWGELAGSVKSGDEGSIVSLTNVEVDTYNNRKHLKSTDLSTVQVITAKGSN